MLSEKGSGACAPDRRGNQIPAYFFLKWDFLYESLP